MNNKASGDLSKQQTGNGSTGSPSLGPSRAKSRDSKQEKQKNGDIITVSKQEYDALKLKADECDALKDKYIRACAEFDNAKKRMEKDKADFIRFANDTFVLDFLPIIDSLEISEKHVKEAKDFKAVQAGVDMIHLQIQKFLKDIGVEKIKTVGEKFDPHLHEAVETEDAKDKDDGLIVGELKPGYMFNGRLLRPASVRIVKKKE